MVQKMYYFTQIYRNITINCKDTVILKRIVDESLSRDGHDSETPTDGSRSLPLSLIHSSLGSDDVTSESPASNRIVSTTR